MPEGAQLTEEDRRNAAAYGLPVGVWQAESGVPVERRTGRVVKQAWRIGGTSQSSFQLLDGLRQQIVAAGYDIVFECADRDCGGFDFRFGIEAIGEPAMHIDLGDYRFLAAASPDETAAVSLLVSRSAAAGFVQIVTVTGGPGPGPASAAPRPADALTDTLTDGRADGLAGTVASTLAGPLSGDIGTAMETVGRFILADLDFATGSSDLGAGPYGSLAELAGYLKANPTARVALVGHTDAEGALAGNIALSKRRAASVMARLIGVYDVTQDQLEAEGIGYLAPIASNQTKAGRTQNRRVEAILISTQ